MLRTGFAVALLVSAVGGPVRAAAGVEALHDVLDPRPPPTPTPAPVKIPFL